MEVMTSTSVSPLISMKNAILMIISTNVPSGGFNNLLYKSICYQKFLPGLLLRFVVTRYFSGGTSLRMLTLIIHTSPVIWT